MIYATSGLKLDEMLKCVWIIKTNEILIGAEFTFCRGGGGCLDYLLSIQLNMLAVNIPRAPSEIFGARSLSRVVRFSQRQMIFSKYSHFNVLGFKVAEQEITVPENSANCDKTLSFVSLNLSLFIYGWILIRELHCLYSLCGNRRKEYVSPILVTLTSRSDSNFERSNISIKEHKRDGVDLNSNGLDYCVRKKERKIPWLSADCTGHRAEYF